MAKVKGKSNLEKPSKLQELLDKNQSFLLRSSGQFHQLQLILKNLIKLVYLASIFLIANLKRLQLDYLDIIFCHRFYEDIPLEETAKAYNDLIEQGLIHYWGTSRLNIIPPVSEQPQYSMIIREKFEVEYRRLFDKYKLRATVWSPLYNNMLTEQIISILLITKKKY
ncbi:aldo/keto reductase family oxidoreductase (macronuclear) [Tetrahymena thermophila SB210]|uniref:Aldo/keto reductase family oxidoreductase n=1 Tax=Tetrahymena thermophila (strain SB210) TaxID=312017 RepID=Q24F79_TETTS|nr:aldo/keto reductase family oxidoreductase [Tetrahymena thermophila SB210]EAS06445.3 aldo/keto reductase family oxidoreductase [Tetrahymena thermophila SB210]|eukprot:XP_001026690.3 aldo/keto reductase family oxidoreductase [Tetrahymena thermophila SB210]